MLCNEFDPERRAIINPEDCYHHPEEGFPEICVGIFSKPIMEWVWRSTAAKRSATLGAVSGLSPFIR